MFFYCCGEFGEIKFGFFQGMFDVNMLIFNLFDVCVVQEQVKKVGVGFVMEVGGDDGLGVVMLFDLDGNLVLFEQY